MSKYSIRINGKTYGLVGRYVVPNWLAEEYCSSDFTLNFGSGSISKEKTNFCFLCDRPFSIATRKCPLLCENTEINRRLGYVGICCVDCAYFLKMKSGYTSIPQSIQKTLNSGFYPINLGKYISL